MIQLGYMRKLFTAAALLLWTLFVSGQGQPRLIFNPDSTFKIVQFTDLHLQADSYRSDSVLVMMKKVIEREKPDLVMLTGDVVGSDNRKRAWLKVAQVMIDAKTPWAAMFGNHDAEYELTKDQTMDLIGGLPYNLTVPGPVEVSGVGNYVLPIQSATSSKTAALCYVFDVSATNEAPEGHSGVYNWIDQSQVTWYKEQSAMFTGQNGGIPVPTLVFFHIPSPEFNEVIGKSTTVGVQQEVEPSSPGCRSNLFEAMQACKDAMGVFVGHHHNNNYIGCLDGICLGFGQASGRQVYGELGAGARVIVLYEDERKFDSWIVKLYESSRDLDIWTPARKNEPMFFVTYPDSFVENREYPGKIHMIAQDVDNVTFRLSGSGVATVDWGDGSGEERVSLNENKGVLVKHTYTQVSTRTISVDGENITALDCKGNGLTCLDVSKARELTHLDCGDNQLARLDVTGNSALRVLWCNGNQLTTLNLAGNSLLTELYCHNNLLAKLDLGRNGVLVRLNCSQNRLTDLQLRANSELNRVDCYENRLTSLDLSDNKKLNYAVCTDNRLTGEALNRLFGTVHEGGAGSLFIGGNPGANECDLGIARGRGWKVRARY